MNIRSNRDKSIQAAVLDKPSLYAAALFFITLWGPPRFRSRDPMAAMSLQVDWSVLLNLLVWGAVALWTFNEFNRYALVRRTAPAVSSAVRWTVLFGLLLGASASLSASPLLTMYKSAQLLLTGLFGYFWTQRFGAGDTLQRIASGALAVTIGILLIGMFFPSYVWAGGRLLAGVLGGSATPALICIVAGLANVGFHHGATRRLAVVAGGLLLVLSEIRAGYVAVAVVLLAGALLGSRHNAARRVFIALLASAPFVIASEAWRGLATYVVRDQASLASLSDRIPLWSVLISTMIHKSPLLGLGFYAIRPYTLAYNPGIGSAHSAYIEVMVGGGVLSLGTLLLAVGFTMKDLWSVARSGDTPSLRGHAQMALGFLVAMLVLAITSDEAVTGGIASFALFVLPGVASVLRHRGDSALDSRT